MCEIDESEIELKFHDLCRLCASYDANKISLFGDEGKRRQLKKKIQICFPFKVDENDALPKSLCFLCVDNLESTWEFRDKCIQVHRNLEKYLSKKEKEKQEKTSSNQSHRIRPEVSIFAIPPTGQTSNNQNANEVSSLPTDSEDGPNPLDFLEVGVNAEDSGPTTNASEDETQSVEVEETETEPLSDPLELDAETESQDGKTSLETSLPPQSKERYMAVYDTYLAWMRSKEETVFSEDLMMTYFTEIGEKFKPSTLWAQYSMLKATMNCNHGIDIGRYAKVLKFLKKKSDGFTSTKAKTLSAEQAERFLVEAPDREFLATKVALIFGMLGSCKPEELCSMTQDNIENHGQVLLVRIPPKRNRPARSFIIDGQYYSIVKRYEALRPARAETNRFFLNYQRGKCTMQVIGKNKFSSMPKHIAEFLDLPDHKEYTGHSLSRHTPTVMTIKRHNSWKSTIKNTRSTRSTCSEQPSTSVGKSSGEVKCKEEPAEDSEDGPTPSKQLKVTEDADIEEDASPVTKTESDPEAFNELVQFNNDRKQYGWNSNKQYLTVEHRTLSAEQKLANAQYADSLSSSVDETLNRRKNNNPRKIARDSDELPPHQPGVTIPTSALRTPGLIAISIAPPTQTNVPPKMTAGSYVLCPPVRAPVPAGKHLAAASEDNQTFSCLLCDQNFTQRTALNKHFSTIHGIEPYEMLSQTPLLAHSSFGEAENVDEELAESMVEQETIIFCEVCRREFQDRASLWLHMVHAHREEASLSCGICLKICSDSITLIEHVNTAHSGDQAVVQRRYSCQVCGRQHDSRQKLLKHATLHTLIDNQGQTIQPEEMISLNNAFAPRECPICHKKFFNQEKLDQHTQNFHNDSHEHTTPTPSVVYKCELCASSHATRIDRWWHMYHSHSGDERVTCAVNTCRKVFVTQTLKEEHCKSHHEAQGPFTNTCEICGKLWESRTVFYKHMMNVHPKCLPTICGVCMKIFSNVPELRHHVRSDHPTLSESSGICCDVCGRSYAERSKMLRHRRVHNVTDGVPFTPNMIKKKDDLQCSICPELPFDTLEEIAEHRRSVHQLFVCDLCPKFYNGNNHLWKHVSKQHKGDPNVTCDICLRTSASRAHLYRHKLKYHADPVDRLIARTPAGEVIPQVHKCPLCSREFRIRSLLKKHSKTCKGIKPPVQKVMPVNGVFPCAKCGKVFEQQGVLSKHMRNSHIIYYCEVCPEVEPKVGFDKKSDLLQHIRDQHANDPELFCDVEGCGKVLRMKADLQKHKLEHSRGYFTYICDCCGDTFSNRKKLRKHLITFHKSDVQHICGVCVAILPSLTELKDHVEVNHPTLMQRPFTCQLCGKCYSVTSKTVDHINKVHGPDYKPCKICWKIFTVEKELDEHVENHPPMEEKPVTPLLKKEPTTPRIRPSKSSFHNELTALGIDYDSEILGKRGAEDYLEGEDSGGKRLRKKYKCPSCKDTFRSILELNEHTPECNGTQDTSNVDGEEDDRSMENYEEEKEIDPKTERWTDIKPIACDCCSKVWNSKKQLWQHLIRSHIPESMHTCGICLRVCQNYYDLFYHLDAQHSNALNDGAARFACYICGHYHNSQSKLDKHFGVHKNAPPPTDYTCQYCQRSYRSVVFYREHVRSHESERNLPKKESSEFSGFSINSILKKEQNDVEDMDSHEDDIECERVDEEDDEDMVELDEDEDSDSENSDSKETSSQDDSVFRGYENTYNNQLPQSSNATPKEEKFAFESMPAYFRNQGEGQREPKQELLEVDDADVDLESNISCSTVDSASEMQEDEDEDMIESESVVNGSQESGDENHGASYERVNNNQQRQDKKVANVEGKMNFHNSNGENYYKRVTE